MSSSLRILSTCRALAIRSRPLAARPARLQHLQPVTRPFASDTTTTQTPVDEADANASPIDRIDDAMLENLLYGGRLSASQQDGALTDAQEEILYREGSILTPQEAAAMSKKMTTTPSSELEDIENPGHKFPLPTIPYPEGINVKARYHPVLEQLSRLIMRDGKLAAAQRVCLSWQKNLSSRILTNSSRRIWLWS